MYRGILLNSLAHCNISGSKTLHIECARGSCTSSFTPDEVPIPTHISFKKRLIKKNKKEKRKNKKEKRKKKKQKRKKKKEKRKKKNPKKKFKITFNGVYPL
jgi:hypothetical protein